MFTFIGMMVTSGTVVSGTGASTVSIPSAESDDTIWAASISARSLNTYREVLPYCTVRVCSNHQTQSKQTFSAEFMPADCLLGMS